MPIVIPLVGATEWPPQIDINKIPPDQHQAMMHISGLLAALTNFERQFRFAVLLFDASAGESNQLIHAATQGTLNWGMMEDALWTTGGWSQMAARDGALAIYHFGSVLNALWVCLPSCPALGVNMEAFAAASKSFHAAFQGQLRHS